MNKLIALTTACFLAMGAFGATPGERLNDSLAQAKILADKQAYDEAAAAIQMLNSDFDVLVLPGWPDALYAKARYLARAGKNDDALAALERAVQEGFQIKPSDLAKTVDFSGLRETARYKAVIAILEARVRLWDDSPFIATPYKPVLSEDEKVSGLSKLWSEARFNFPFFDRIPDLDWDAAYTAYLPQVRAAKTTEEYYKLLARFMSLLKDGHTLVLLPPEIQDRIAGVTDVDTRLVQGKVVVTKIGDPALIQQGLKIGAEVTAIDGRPVLDYAKNEIEPQVSGYTPQDRNLWQYGYLLLRGPVTEPVHLTVKDGGKTLTLAIPRRHNGGLLGHFPEPGTIATFSMLPGNLAYLRINSFMADEGAKAFREHFTAISAADGLVLDVRDNGGGNTGNAVALVQMLTDKPFRGSNWKTQEYRAVRRSWKTSIEWYREQGRLYSPDSTIHYGKPVAVLIGPRTYSSAEDFLDMLMAAGRGTLIGEASGGSTGNPMWVKLPGGGGAMICTEDAWRPDGQVFEGTGFTPDIKVAPTIADIRAGKDPVLDRAVKFLKSGH